MKVLKTFKDLHLSLQIVLVVCVSLLTFYLVSHQGTLTNLLHLFPGLLVIGFHFHSPPALAQKVNGSSEDL